MIRTKCSENGITHYDDSPVRMPRLSKPQARVMAFLKTDGKWCSVAYIAVHLGRSKRAHGAIRRTLDSLARKGWILTNGSHWHAI